MVFSITAADAAMVFTIPAAGLTFLCEGWSADGMYDYEANQQTETRMSIDGILSGGVVLTPKVMTLKFEANSPTTAFFDAWIQLQVTQRAVLPADAVLTFNNAGKVFAHTKGFLTNAPMVPPANKVLMPRAFQITWQTVVPF